MSLRYPYRKLKILSESLKNFERLLSSCFIKVTLKVRSFFIQTLERVSLSVKDKNNVQSYRISWSTHLLLRCDGLSLPGSEILVPMEFLVFLHFVRK